MENLYNGIKGLIISSALTVVAICNPASAEEQAAEVEPVAQVNAVQETAATARTQPVNNWQEFHSVPGNCKLSFPAYPEHVSEKMSLSEEGYDLIYDAYISSLDKQTVFMLLVAQYPEFVDESYAQMSLEGFLNGILSHNPSNQLIFADLVLVEGHSGLDFFIRTGNVYFKGRAIMVKNNLYLMAMECAIQTYDETHYNHFINSFQLSK
jgi:hypothetical protein